MGYNLLIQFLIQHAPRVGKSVVKAYKHVIDCKSNIIDLKHSTKRPRPKVNLVVMVRAQEHLML